MEYFNSKTLKRVGNFIGTILKVDINTAQQHRRKFARICVEVDLSKPLVSGYSLDGDNFRMEYEGIHMVYFGCGVYGHTKENCLRRREEVINREAQRSKDVAVENDLENFDSHSSPIIQKPEDEEEVQYGSCMMEPQRSRRPTAGKPGGRFSIPENKGSSISQNRGNYDMKIIGANGGEKDSDIRGYNEANNMQIISSHEDSHNRANKESDLEPKNVNLKLMVK